MSLRMTEEEYADDGHEIGEVDRGTEQGDPAEQEGQGALDDEDQPVTVDVFAMRDVCHKYSFCLIIHAEDACVKSQ